ncbi:MAG: hypothetical protein ACI9OJ_004272 [Myxococcota bacterium]|jgi:hypothetical protein
MRTLRILTVLATAQLAACSSDDSTAATTPDVFAAADVVTASDVPTTGSDVSPDATVAPDTVAPDTAAPDTAVEPDVMTGPGHPVLDPPPAAEGVQLTMFATVPASSEMWICDVKPMPFEGIGFNAVKRVEVVQNPGTHHLTLSTLGLVPSGSVAYGRYDCGELYGDSSLMEDQIMFYGNQGTAEDTMLLPDGVAAKIPTGLDVIHEVHYVNPTPEPVELYSYINAWTVDDSPELEGVWGGSVRDEHIVIPAGAGAHTEWSRCTFNEDVEIHFLASHMHELGTQFDIAPFDGGQVGDTIYTNDDWHVPNIVQFNPPIVRKKGEGFEWTCTWDNTGGDLVNYGPTSTDEMCNMAVVHTPFSVTAACEVVESSDGELWVP